MATTFHHRPNLLHSEEENQRPALQSSGVFQRYRRKPDIALAAVGRRLWGGERAYKSRLGKDRSPRTSRHGTVRAK
jgi:hypothetical protein